MQTTNNFKRTIDCSICYGLMDIKITAKDELVYFCRDCSYAQRATKQDKEDDEEWSSKQE